MYCTHRGTGHIGKVRYNCITDIEDIIATLDVIKAVGQDLISHRVLKNVRFTISKPLCILFNKSLDEGIFPSKWKTALVMPLYKKGDKHCSGNYRRSQF